MKTQLEEFDLVILGGGTGSTIAAWTFAGEGKHVAVVDRKYIGGACPDTASLPRKNIRHSAQSPPDLLSKRKIGPTLHGCPCGTRGRAARAHATACGWPAEDM